MKNAEKNNLLGQKSVVIVLIYPSLLGKIKPYQNLFLIFFFILLILSITLNLSDNKFISKLTNYLFLLSSLFAIPLIMLSIPFLFEKTRIATIVNEIIYIDDISGRSYEFKIQSLKFLLSIDKRYIHNNKFLESAAIEPLPIWGNYILITSNNKQKDIYIQFLPDEDFLKILPKLHIEINKTCPILYSSTTQLLKSFISMAWSAGI